MNPFRLDGKVAVVTGAAGLLGAELCRTLAEAGAKVISGDLDPEAVRRATGSLPGEVHPVDLNVCDAPSIRGALRMALDRWDRVDILANNAAVDDKFETPPLIPSKTLKRSISFSRWARASFPFTRNVACATLWARRRSRM